MYVKLLILQKKTFTVADVRKAKQYEKEFHFLKEFPSKSMQLKKHLSCWIQMFGQV